MKVQNIRVVLVETTHPGNIGAAARAMKNMGLPRLVLVRPARFPDAEATALATHASDILAGAQVVASLDEALAGCGLVIGASARRRGIAAPTLDPRQGAARAAEFSDAAQVALVFGRESSGLTNDELDRCHYVTQIPADPAHSSLNLAAAVLIIAYELRMHTSLAVDAPPAATGDRPATAEEMGAFFAHLEQTLLATGFLNPANPRHLMRRLRRLFNKAQPDEREINILRGVLSSVQGRKRPRP